MTRQDLENLYVLSPLQQGLLFHSLYSPASGLYVDQFILELKGELRPDLLERAWQVVVSRHASLRTSFHWENLDRPLQVVLPNAQLPFAHHDWRDLSSADQEERLNSYLAEDRAHGFQLSEAPLMRLALIRLSDDSYRLVWSVHHIILDAWSASIVQNEVLSSYAAFLREESPSFQASPPFSTYISWLRQQDLSQAETFWRKALAGFTSPTRLAIDNACGDAAEDDADVEIRLSQAATSRLVAFAQRHQLTLNTILQGAWSLLLQRYSGEQDVVFGVTVSGRAGSIPGVEDMVGNLLNTLPFRVRIASQDVLSFLREIQDSQLQLRDYEYSPLTEIQKWSELPSNEPLFDSILVFENAPSVNVNAGFNGSIQIGHSRHLFRTNYALTVQIIPGPNLFVRIRAASPRFNPKVVERMLGHLETLLEGIVANPNRRASTLPLLTEAELKQVTSNWNSTEAEYPHHSTMHELFEAQAAKAPDTVAVVCQGEQLTYGELNRRANQLAHYLRQRGAGPESLIGICLERSVEMIVGIVGTLKAGAAYVPLDPAYPPQRLSFMLEDARVPVLLTQERLRDGLPVMAAEVVSLDVDWDEIGRESDANPGVAVDGRHPAYVIYTSGSTGRPKGVMVKQGSLVNLCYGLKEFFADEQVKNAALITSISFDISVNQIFPTLVFGRTLHVIANEVKYDPAAFLEYLEEREIDLFDCVPSYLNSVLREGAGKGEGSRGGVKYILVGGEKVERSLLEKVFERWPEAALVNIYGLTEITDINTLSVIRRSDANEAITIGRPLQNTRVYITDEHYNLQPVGVSGELCVAGDGVSRGYLNRPEMTAEKFVPAPWEEGEAMCRTGDVARWLEDGRIELLGRRDQQVKIRGYRVEVGEIEVLLESHPEVKEAVVVMREDVAGDRRLVAYLATAADGALSAELAGFLKERLPEYMVPSAFVMLEELPHLPNGKINRNSLPAPEGVGSESLGAYVPPQNELERILAGIWQDVLQTPQVGVHDNFFSDLGGNSLMLIQVVGKLREGLGRDISIIEMFQFPTINSFAQHLAASKQESPSVDETADQTLHRREAMQQRRQMKQQRRTMTAEQGAD